MIPVVIHNHNQITSYDWDLKTFTCILNNTYVNFGNMSNITINVQNNCKIITGPNCIINAGNDCSLFTGKDCTIKAGPFSYLKIKKPLNKSNGISLKSLRLFKMANIHFMSVNSIDHPISEQEFINLQNLLLTFESI